MFPANMSAQRLLSRLGSTALQLRGFSTRRKSAYNYFVSAGFKTAKIQQAPRNEKLTWIAQAWKNLSVEEKERWMNYAEEKNGPPGRSDSVVVPVPKKRSSPPAPKPKTRSVKPALSRRSVKLPQAKKRAPARASPLTKLVVKLRLENKALKASLSAMKKKAPTPYQCFVKSAHQRPEIKALPFEKRASRTAQLWKQLSEEERKPYVEEAAKKTPLAPQRAPTPYRLFFKSAYSSKEIRELPFEKRTQAIAKLWKELPEYQKKPFAEQAAAHPSSKLAKLPRSAYGLFVQSQYSSKEVQELPAPQRLSKIAGLWKALSKKDKEVFEKEFARRKEEAARVKEAPKQIPAPASTPASPATASASSAEGQPTSPPAGKTGTDQPPRGSP